MRILRVLTAALFAFALFQAIQVYHILEFPYAFILAPCILFVSYWFLSQKYERFLALVFFGFAVYVGWNALSLKAVPSETPSAQKRLDRLFLKVARLKLGEDIEKIRENGIEVCKPPHCAGDLPHANTTEFWIFENKPWDDKGQELWYIDDHLNVFVKKQNQFEKLL